LYPLLFFYEYFLFHRVCCENNVINSNTHMIIILALCSRISDYHTLRTTTVVIRGKNTQFFRILLAKTPSKVAMHFFYSKWPVFQLVLGTNFLTQF
ncbi:MAG: hypothetical protein ACXADY_17130, partial [Candidatus Hodarchaeales archaeon]